MTDTNRFFDSSFNYQKILLKGSSTDVVANGVSSTTVTITHDLGSIGSARVWYEPDNGKRFPASFEQYVDNGVGSGEVNQVTVQNMYLTSTTLVIVYTNQSGSNKTVTTYYRIYYDA